MSDAKYSDLLARGSERTRLKAKSRGHEINAANLIRNVRNNLTAAIAMDDPLLQGHVFNTVQSWITQAVNNGDITPRQGLLMGEKFIQDFGVGVVSNMETERALEMLKRGRTTDPKTGRYSYTKDPENPNPADFIEDAERSKMIRTLEGRNKAEQYEVDLVTREDGIMDKAKDKGWTRTRALEEAGKAPPKYRHDLRQRVIGHYDNVEKETLRVLRHEQQAEDKAMKEAEEIVRRFKGTKSAIDLKLELRQRIGADGMALIDEMAKRLRSGKRPKPTPESEAAINDILMSTPAEQEKLSNMTGLQFRRKYFNLLPEDDYARAERFISGLKGADQKELRRIQRGTESEANGNRAVTSIIKSQGLKKNADKEIIGSLGKRMRRYIEQQIGEGHAVTGPEADKFAAGLLLEGYIEGTGAGVKVHGIRRIAVMQKTGRRIQFLGTAQEEKFRLDLDEENWEEISDATGIPQTELSAYFKEAEKQKRPMTLRTLLNIRATYLRLLAEKKAGKQ
jgi:hypothetical protein